MAIRRIYPDKDASIEDKEILPGTSTYVNEGRDEILEIGKYQDQNGTIREKRVLIRFSPLEVGEVLAKVSGSYTAELNLKHCHVRGSLYPRNFQICAVSGSWEEGLGTIYKNSVQGPYLSRFQDLPQGSKTTLEGVTWANRGRNEEDRWENLGGDFYNNPTPLSLEYPTTETQLDFSVDITSLLPSSSNGFLIRLEDDWKAGNSYLHSFYSRQTHTIHRPYLEVRWNDQKWETSMKPLPQGRDFYIERNSQDEYIYPNQEYKFYISPKVKYPTRVFSTSSLYIQNYTLPSSSVWRLRDEEAGEILVDFHPEYTRVHSDEVGNYVTFHTSLLEPERYYRLEIGVTDGEELRIKEAGTSFKLV